MNIIKWTNKIALGTSVFLVYWTFLFILISVFGLKIFQENLTEIFFTSLAGVFAILPCALMLNVMFNLTRIADNTERVEIARAQEKRNKTYLVIFFAAFPALALIGFGGDYLSSKYKEKILLEQAEVFVKEYHDTIRKMADYSLNCKYVQETGENLTLMSKVDESFPSISVLILTERNSKDYILQFKDYYHNSCAQDNKKYQFIFSNYVYPASAKERDFLRNMLEGKRKDRVFSAHDGFYELYYPVTVENKNVVLYFTDRSSYGKFGS